jgi:DNA invertase Pin-like site-specific DNA recombinase
MIPQTPSGARKPVGGGAFRKRTSGLLRVMAGHPWDTKMPRAGIHERMFAGRAMAQGKFISYLRVSTDKQGRSGLGIEAQREAVTSYLNGGRWTLVAEYVETESGRRSDRPKLAAALSHAKAVGAKLVFAKLDRLTRNVDLLRSLVASEVDLVFCDLPSVPPGPMGKFLLTQMAAVAELEAGLIGERTKKALAAAKARGVKLGNPNGARALRGKQTGNTEAVTKIKQKAAQRALDLQGIIDGLKRSGITTVRSITSELNRQGISAPRGSTWHPTAVARLLGRLSP